MRFLPIILILSISDYLAHAQVWSLEKCINHALENNLQVKQQELNLETSEFDLLQNKMSLLPTLNANLSHTYNFGRSLDLTTYNFVNQTVRANGISLTGNLTLFNGFNKLNRIKQSKYDFMASQYQLQNVKDDIRMAVLNNYLQILFGKEQLAIMNGQVKIATQQVEKTRLLVDVGKLANGALLDLQAQLANDELNKVNAENQLGLAYLDMKHLLQLPITDQFDIEDPDVTIDAIANWDTLTLTSVYDYAIGNHPNVKSSEFTMKSAQLQFSSAKGRYYPSLSMYGNVNTDYASSSQEVTFVQISNTTYIGYVTTTFDTVVTPTPSFSTTYQDIPFLDQLGDNLRYALGFTLSVPIFNGLSTRYSVKQSKVNALKAINAWEIAKNQLKKDVQQAYANSKAAQKKYEASLKRVEAVNLSFEYTHEKFNAGMVSSVDYSVAKNDKVAAESNLIQAKYEYLFKVKILDYYQGKPLQL